MRRVLLAGWIAANSTLSAQAPADRFVPPPAKYPTAVEKNLWIPMRDGIRLAADRYHPVGVDGRLPVIVIRTPYNKDTNRGSTRPAQFFAEQGYVVLVQDVRGKHQSEGRFTVQGSDQLDGYDTIDWASRQPWSTGKIGTFGCSYSGEVQILAAGARHPNHLAAIPQAAGGGLGSAGGYWSAFAAYENGVLGLSSALGWFASFGGKDKWAGADSVDYATVLRSVPVAGMMKRITDRPTDWEDYVTHRPGSPYWSTQGYATDTTRYDVPALHVDSWLDFGAEQVLHLFNLFRTNAVSARARDNQYVIISPTEHCRSERATEHTMVGERDVGDARLPYSRIYLDWFDHWLKGQATAIASMPKVQYYEMGSNRWRTAAKWPVPGMRAVSYYLGGGRRGQLSLERGARAAADTIVSNPDDPFPSRGGTICCTGNPNDVAGIFDQANLESRPDLLTYSTAPLARPVTLAGPVRAVIYLSSDATDTDLVAKLIDVAPDGRAWNVVSGIGRARYREGIARPALMTPRQVYRVEVNLKSIAYRFLPGHRIRLYLTGSDFPAFERNSNTGGAIYDETSFATAHNLIHSGSRQPSALVLPVVPN